MRLRVCKDMEEWVNVAWEWMHTEVQPRARVFVPAGGTPQAIYQSWRDRKSDLLPSLKLIQIDDIVTGPKRGLFKRFLLEELPHMAGQLEFIDRGDATADIALLGVGVNGHVAFHEPDLPEDFYSGCVPLTEMTKRYLELLEPTWGVTYGASAFLQSKKILVLAKGEKKREILREALTQKSCLPVAQVLRHSRATLVTDFPL